MANKEQSYCNICKANGFPDIPIDFAKNGWDQEKNKQRWKPINIDGSEHVHRQSGNERPSQSQPSVPAQKSSNLPIDEVMEVTSNVNTMLQAGWVYLNSFWNPTNGAVTYIIGRKKQ